MQECVCVSLCGWVKTSNWVVCVGVEDERRLKWEREREGHCTTFTRLPSCLLKAHSFIRRQSCSAHNVELFRTRVRSILYAGTWTQGVSTIISTLLERKLVPHFLEDDHSKKRFSGKQGFKSRHSCEKRQMRFKVALHFLIALLNL